MPELPEAEVVAGQLRAHITGAVWKDCWLGRPDIVRQGLETVDWYRGARLTRIARVGKSVLVTCVRTDETRYLVAELGMTGLLLFRSPHARYDKHTHMILSLQDSQESEVRYWNPRRFGRIHLLAKQDLELFLSRRFGVDPLTVPYAQFRELVKKRRGRLKALLMHQQAIAGIGNIYANEILFRARLHPDRMASRLGEPAIERLYRAIQHVLSEAVTAGGSSVRDFLAPDGRKGLYTFHHLVYGKTGTPCANRCGRVIQRLIGERTSFYCPACQRR